MKRNSTRLGKLGEYSESDDNTLPIINAKLRRRQFKYNYFIGIIFQKLF